MYASYLNIFGAIIPFGSTAVELQRNWSACHMDANNEENELLDIIKELRD